MKQIGDSGKPKLKFWQPWIDKGNLKELKKYINSFCL